MPEREAKKVAAEMLRPVNQGLVTVGSAVNFTEYVDTTYIPIVLPLLAKTTFCVLLTRVRTWNVPISFPWIRRVRVPFAGELRLWLW